MSILLYTFWAHSLMLVVSANTKPSMLKLSSLAEQSASPPIILSALSSGPPLGLGLPGCCASGRLIMTLNFNGIWEDCASS